eukprot:Gb_03634 [translate_table: standard]
MLHAKVSYIRRSWSRVFSTNYALGDAIGACSIVFNDSLRLCSVLWCAQCITSPVWTLKRLVFDEMFATDLANLDSEMQGKGLDDLLRATRIHLKMKISCQEYQEMTHHHPRRERNAL